MRVRRLVGATTVMLTALAAFAGPASAETHGRIVQITSDNGRLTVLFRASGLPTGAALDPASAQLRIGTQLVQATASTVGTSSAPSVSRTAVIVIDESGSMIGAGISGAKAAAQQFLAKVPADVQVGLVAFSDTAHLLVRPTTDRGAVRSAVQGLAAKGETALYDGVSLALSASGTSGARSLVLLTDGADTRSRNSLATVVRQISSARVSVDAVAFRTNDAQTAPLRQIAQAGAGQVYTTGKAADLAAAFAESAREISNEIVVTADVPASVANTSQTISVQATASGTTVSDSAFIHLSAKQTSAAEAGKPIPVPIRGGLAANRNLIYVGVLALFVGLALILSTALWTVSARAPRTGMRRRLSIYTLTGRVAEETRETTVLGDSAVARSAMELAGRVVARRDLESRLARKLEAGAIPMKPAEWLLLHTSVAIGAGLLFLLLSSGGLVATVVGLIVGALLPFAYLSLKESRRTAAFLAQMPDTLQLLAGSLQAGYSLPQAVDAVVREGAEPIAGEFNKALIEARLGVPLEDALESCAHRMGSPDFEWVVMAIRIQREVGGNLAEVLMTVSATLRERERLRRQVKVLSAEGRLSAWILCALPPLFALYLLLVRREYLRLLYTDVLGLVMLAVGLVLMTVGVLWMRKVIKVDV